MKFLKDKFRMYREKNRWTVVALAKELNVSKVTIHAWQNGSGKPSSEKAAQIARLFNIPVSELYESLENQTAETSRSIDDRLLKISNFEDTELFRLLKLINKKVEENCLVANIIPKLTPVPTYIKNRDLKYVYTNHALGKLYNLPEKCNINGMTDLDLYPGNEAINNKNEDESVLKTLRPIVNKEAPIPGLKGKWGLISKFPMIDEKNQLVGIAGMIVDITERRKSEMLRIILEDCLKNCGDISLWIGKGLRTQSPFQIKRILYVLKFGSGKISEDEFGSVPGDKLTEYFYSLVKGDKRKNIDFRQISSTRPIEVRYEMNLSPGSTEYCKIREIIRYDSTFDVYYGVMIDVTKQDTLLSKARKHDIETLEELLNNSGIEKNKTERIIAEFTAKLGAHGIQEILENKQL